MDNHYEKPKHLTKHPSTDTKNQVPQSSTSQVAGYPGTGGQMLLEWVAEYSGMRNSSGYRSK